MAADPNNRMASSPERRDQAMRQLLDRRDGLPPQRMQLEAEIRATTTHTVISAPELTGLPPRQLGAVVDALRAALTPSRVIDVHAEGHSLPAPTMAVKQPQQT